MVSELSGRAKTIWCAGLSMIAFAGNSLFCRAALTHTQIDAMTFTLTRIVSGLLTLWLLVHLRDRRRRTCHGAANGHGPDGGTGSPGGNAQGRAAAGTAVGRPRGDAADRRRVALTRWWPALLLFGYAVTFSFAYTGLALATGALILFGAVEATMIAFALRIGERYHGRQLFGFVVAAAAFVVLLLPGASAPAWFPSLLMIAAGVFWGLYSLAGRGAVDPLASNVGHFARASVPVILLSMVMIGTLRPDPVGIAYGIASGGLASGVGYALWYAAMRSLRAGSAAVIQLSVPLIAALGGVVFLDEALTLRLMLVAIGLPGGLSLALMPARPQEIALKQTTKYGGSGP